MLAWVTPEEPPGDDICIKVYCPSGVAYEAALRGAILSLTEEENWEKVFLQDVDVVAAAFNRAFGKTVKWRRCVPVGTVYNFGGDTVPEGSLLCDGASYDTDNYPLLFEAIAYNWGGGGGSFNVPDMQERFALGVGDSVSLADSGGMEDVTLAEGEMPRHNHDTFPATLGPAASGGPVLDWIWSGLPTGNTGYAGNDEAHENMPPYAALLPCIVAS